MKFRILLTNVFIFAFVLNISCTLNNSKKKENDRYDVLSLLVSYIKSQSNHTLYKYIYDPKMSSTNGSSQFIPATLANKSDKKKLILIHGWDHSERSSDPPTSHEKKVTNINGTWSSVLDYYNRDIAYIRSNYDLYTFTYRTSDSIALNGERFIETLIGVFTKSDKIVIMAHSMGGLVTRFGVYDPKNSVDVIDFVITLGTPHYGSPFSSSSYQQNNALLGDFYAFLTNTDGGKGLAHTNNGNGQIQITNASNQNLDALNANTAKDSIFYPYVGDLQGNCSNAVSSTTLAAGCTILASIGSPAFTNNDGVVPTNSAKMANKSTSQITVKTGFDHQMISFRIPTNTTQAGTFFAEVMSRIDSFSFP